MNRIVYFLYYLKRTPFSEFKYYLNFVSKEINKNRAYILSDIIRTSFKYNISILDYFYFQFYMKNNQERIKWGGTGFMYEYQKLMNPKKERYILEDKIQFLNIYHDFIERKWCSVEAFKQKKDIISSILNNDSNKIVVKGSKGQVGAEVNVLDSRDYNCDSLEEFMLKNDYDLLEEAVVQHSELMKLSASGLNTIRIVTQINSNGEVDILAARLRVSVNSFVDNLGAGNFAVAIDEKNGVVISDGVFSDITKVNVTNHPVTGIKLKGFKVPNWDMVIDIAKKAALFQPQNKSIGWDVAVKQDSVELIEGNHNWCKLLYQLPINKGMKKTLLNYL